VKIDSNNSVVERNGLASDGRYSIVFNAKMANLLANGIYSDKIQSVIRELSCNAIDSHTEAGIPDHPIEVHLPSVWEPWFHVRDFGVGLDHDQVIGIYTVYGASTKTNSNELIGALGLGSKSPFSYVDAFDVTACKNGVKRQYSMYKSEDGMPAVALLSETATTEPNGVTVKMPVKQEDIRRFSEKSAIVYSWFNVKPIITGVKGLNIPVHQYMHHGNGWALRCRDTNHYPSDMSNRAVALMGRVAYPLEPHSIHSLSVAQHTLLTMPIVLTFDIGDLEIAASRESLGYDKRTQEAIRIKLDVMLAELGKEFQTCIAASATEWEARMTFGKMFGNESGFRYDFEKIFGNTGVTWNNTVIKEAYILLDTKDLWDVNNYAPPLLWSSKNGFKTMRQLSSGLDILTIHCNTDTVIVFDDLKTGAQSRVNYMREQRGIHALTVFLIGPSQIKTVDEIAIMLGNPPYIMASSLPKRPGAAREKIHMLQYTRGIGTKAWEPVDIELDDGGIYVTLDRFTVMDGTQPRENLEHIRDMAIDLGIIPKNQVIHAPRVSMSKKVEKHENWTNLFTLIREKIDTLLTPEIFQSVSDMLEYGRTVQSAKDVSLWQTHFNLHKQDGVYAQFVKTMRDLENKVAKNQKHNTLLNLARIFDNISAIPAPSVDATSLYNMMMAHYPMISLAFDRYSSRNIGPHNIKVYENYINMVDDYTTRLTNDAAIDLIAA